MRSAAFSGERRRSSLTTTAGLALAAFAARAQAGDDCLPTLQPLPTTTGELSSDVWGQAVETTIKEAPAGISDASMGARIARLGKSAIPAVFALFEGFDGGMRLPVTRGALLAAFRAFDAADVVRFVSSKIDETTPRATLIGLLQVSGEVAGRDCTHAALDAASRMKSIDLRSPFFGGVARAAIAAALARDPAGWSYLRRAWSRLDPAVAAVALLAVEETRSMEGLRFLAERLGDGKTDAATLGAMCRMPRLVPRPLGGDVLRRVRLLTKGTDARTRALAVILLGRVRDEQAFDVAVEMVADSDPETVEAARSTLHRLTGADVGADADQWRQWRAAAREWETDRLPGQLELLRSPDHAVVLETLTTLGAAPLFARDVVREVAAQLNADQPAVRAAACAALGGLDDPSAAGALVAALSDQHPDVVKAAGSALNSITGLNLAPEPSVWASVVR